MTPFSQKRLIVCPSNLKNFEKQLVMEQNLCHFLTGIANWIKSFKLNGFRGCGFLEESNKLWLWHLNSNIVSKIQHQ